MSMQNRKQKVNTKDADKQHTEVKRPLNKNKTGTPKHVDYVKTAKRPTINNSTELNIIYE